MDYIEPEVTSPSSSPQMAAGEWYLKGFMDAYSAHLAIAPRGPAGEQYKRGYDEGLAAVQRDFFAATWC